MKTKVCRCLRLGLSVDNHAGLRYGCVRRVRGYITYRQQYVNGVAFVELLQSKQQQHHPQWDPGSVLRAQVTKAMANTII